MRDRSATWIGLGGLLAALLLVASPACAQVPSFAGVEINPGFIPTAINASGQMAGYADFGGQIHAARLTNGVVTDLGVLAGGDHSEATGINASGQVVGSSTRTGGLTHAFLYSGSAMIDLGTLPGGATSRAAAINDAGQVAGTSDTLQPATSFPRPDHAFRYSGGVMTDLGNISATANFANFSEAKGINASGTVVGWSVTDAFETHAFRSAGGPMSDLGTLGGSESRATGINDAGAVSGWSLTGGDAAKHAFKYAASMTDLGTLTGNNNSVASAINKDALVVGDSTFNGTPAFIQSTGSGMVRLDTLVSGPGWFLSRAPAINANAQVIAYGSNASVFATYFLLTPVPTVPGIGSQPSNQAVLAGAVANFTVSASGLPTPTLQWQQSTDGGTVWSNVGNGGAFAGVTTTTLSVTTTIGMNGYRYRAVASNSAGTATSNSALLSVTPAPSLSIADVSVTEGNAGTKLATFTVSLSPVAAVPVSFDIGTQVGTATPGVDYLAQSTTGVVIAAGQSSATFSVTVNGDTTVEGNETFTVNITNASGAPVSDGQALGTIINDDNANLSIADASVIEGNAGTSTLRFVISLATPMPTAVTFDIATANGTAIAGSDYVARSQPGRVIDAGRTQAVFEVPVTGDTAVEADETLSASISNIVGAIAGSTTATGTIVNDDGVALVASIAQIQGAGAVSPLVGQAVATEGIVTARVRDGIWLQSPDAEQDGNAATSEGLFVAANPDAVAVGDRLRVTGTVREALDTPDAAADTRLTVLAAQRLDVLGHGATLPRPVSLDASEASPAAAATALEAREGMRVIAPWLVVVAPDGGRVDAQGRIHGDGQFHAVVEGVARPFAADADAALASGDPGNPQRLRVVSDAQLGSPPHSADVGDRISGMIGVLGQGATGYALQPDPASFGAVVLGARPQAARAPRAGEQTLAWFDLQDHSQGHVGTRATDAPRLLRLAKIAHAVVSYAQAPAIVVVTGLQDSRLPNALAEAITAKAGAALFSEDGADEPHYRAYRATGAAGVGVLVDTRRRASGAPRVEVLSVETQTLPAAVRNRDRSSRSVFDAPPLLVRLRLSDAGGGSKLLALLVLPTSAQDATAAGRTGVALPRSAADLLAWRAAQAHWIAVASNAHARRQPAEPLVVFSDVGASGVADVGAGGGLRALGAGLAASERYDATREGNAVLIGQVLVDPAFLAAWPRAQLGLARINADFSADNASDARVPMGFADRDPQLIYLPGD